MPEDRHDNEGYRRFREALQSGKLEAGMVVTQHDLCELLGLSLSPLRETLVLLEEFGLVEIKPRTGIRIVYPEVAFIRENYQFRIMIEIYALRSFGDTVTEEWLANMRESHEACRRNLTDGGVFEEAQLRFLALDNRMHREIVEALDNRSILDTHQRLQDNIRMAQQVHRRPGDEQGDVADHGRPGSAGHLAGVPRDPVRVGAEEQVVRRGEVRVVEVGGGPEHPLILIDVGQTRAPPKAWGAATRA